MPPRLLDPRAYPHAAALVEGLPRGYRAYPECSIVADFHCQTMRATPEVFAALPAELAAVLWHHDRPHAFMPLALYMVGQLVALDNLFGGAVAPWQAQVRSRAAALFAAPLYRTLFHLLSPNLLLMGLERRFAALCRGPKLSNVSVGRQRHEARLVHPPGLAPQPVLDFFAATFAAALDATGATDVQVVGAAVAPEEARFHGRWH